MLSCQEIVVLTMRMIEYGGITCYLAQSVFSVTEGGI
jgi:hypothetical protein